MILAAYVDRRDANRSQAQVVSEPACDVDAATDAEWFARNQTSDPSCHGPIVAIHFLLFDGPLWGPVQARWQWTPEKGFR